MNLQPVILLPAWVSALILVAVVAVPTTMWHAFWRTGTGHKINGSGTISVWLASIMVLWIVAAISLSLDSFFEDKPSILNFNVAYLFLPLLAGVAWWSISRDFREILRTVRPDWMIRIQIYRVLGFVYLVSWYRGLLPGALAIPAGVGDVLVGTSAPFMAVRVRGHSQSTIAGILWNLFGIKDMVVGVALGLLTSASPFHQLGKGTRNRDIMITAFRWSYCQRLSSRFRFFATFIRFVLGPRLTFPPSAQTS